MPSMRCPKNDCNALLSFKDEALGKRAKCPKCGLILTLGAAVAQPQPAPTAAAGQLSQAQAVPHRAVVPSVDDLLKRLPRDTGPNPTDAFCTLDQKDAVEQLAARGAEVVPTLVGNLARSTGCARALGKIGDKSAIQPLLRELQCGDWRRAEAAARALGVMKATEAVAALTKLRDTYSGAEVAQAAVWALEQMPKPAGGQAATQAQSVPQSAPRQASNSVPPNMAVAYDGPGAWQQMMGGLGAAPAPSAATGPGQNPTRGTARMPTPPASKAGSLGPGDIERITATLVSECRWHIANLANYNGMKEEYQRREREIVRPAGERLAAAGGVNLMKGVYGEVERQVGQSIDSALSGKWDGIGGWMW